MNISPFHVQGWVLSDILIADSINDILSADLICRNLAHLLFPVFEGLTSDGSADGGQTELVGASATVDVRLIIFHRLERCLEKKEQLFII